MRVEEPRFRLWINPALTAEEYQEAASEICRILIDPPLPQAERRAIAVRQALAQYQGAPSRRAKQLADRYRSYLAAGWLHERDLESLPRSNALGRTRAGLLC
jgi:hypothetical protein